jgi:amidohydrolase
MLSFTNMSKSTLKKKLFEAVEARSEDIIEAGRWIWRHPEVGFKEYKTAEYTAGVLRKLGLDVEEHVGLTGVVSRIEGCSEKPNIAVIGELDALLIPEHPDADQETGAVHSCGHNCQMANMIGVAMSLVDSDIMKHLDGSVTCVGVPSEEPIEIEWRRKLFREGKLFFLGGKQEFIKDGYFDDIDISLSDHMSTNTSWKIAVRGGEEPTPGGVGFMGKMITFKGAEAHSGAAPWNGVNALNAAHVAMTAIDAQRETFKDSDAVRVHYFITKGGDAVNIVPSEVRMEMMIRAASVEAIKDASMKVDRALKGGAMALGAEAVIENIPGYLPSPTQGSPTLWRCMRDNALELFGPSEIVIGSDEPTPVRVPHGAVSDINDVASVMPKASFNVGGAVGVGHSRNYRIEDEYNAYVNPTKLYVGMIFDLLWDGAKLAKNIINEYKPPVTKEGYLDYWKDILNN